MSFIRNWIFVLFIVPSKAAFPPSFRYPLPVVFNKINNVVAACDAGSFNVTLALEHPFKGLLFAKDFAQECKTVGTLRESVSIQFPTFGCGIRLSSKTDADGNIRMYYSVTLVVQQDRHLRQITDQEKHVQCMVENSAFAINSQSVANVLKHDLKKAYTNHRTGRTRFDGWSKDIDEDLEETRALDEALLAARAWMEIVPETESEDGRTSEILKVGEPSLLTVKSTLPAGIGWKVVDCVAHDGLGESSQKLLDEHGCPVDDQLLPVPKLGPVRPIALMRHQEAIARFAAFKFPDRDRLHMSCSLQLCRGSCPMLDCFNVNSTSENRLGRMSFKGQQGEILDRLEVFNSVEVIAPEIDDVKNSEDFQTDEEATYPFNNIPGDKTFCVSLDKMAIAFCILGVIFLGAVIVASVSLFKARKAGNTGPYYTRSIFSSSSSGSGYGSKLLLRESPCTSQTTSRGLQYGRIF